MSWFGLLYPDPDAKDHGGSGASQNVFDCRYNRYCPRLDAVAYYNGVNSIAAKKFTDEKMCAGGINVILFRDSEQRSLQVVWKDKGRQDVSIPLAGVGQVQIIRMDGSRRVVGAGQKSATLSVTEDPLLLICEGGPTGLPAALEERDGNRVVEFTFTPSAASAVREADRVVTFSDSKGTRCGELYLRCPLGE